MSQAELVKPAYEELERQLADCKRAYVELLDRHQCALQLLHESREELRQLWVLERQRRDK